MSRWFGINAARTIGEIKKLVVAWHLMTGLYAKFKNDLGLAEIGIGVTEFKCIGASPPHDHPHIYHKIGEQGFVHCLYCNTKYFYRPHLGRLETDPPGNLFEVERVDS